MSETGEGDKLYGQRNLRESPGVEIFYKQIMPYFGDAGERHVTGEGDENTDIEPRNRMEAEVTAIDLTATQAILDAAYRLTNGSVDTLRLPDELLGVTAIFAESSGEGSDENPIAQQIIEPIDPTEFNNQTLTPSAQAQSSAVIATDLDIDIQHNVFEGVDTINLTFWAPENSTLAAVDAIAEAFMTLALGSPITLNPWPKWGEKTHRLLVRSERVNIRVNAQTKASLSEVSFAGVKTRAWSGGHSYDVDLTLRPISIGPVINDDITISPSSDTQDVTATADASTPIINDGYDPIEVPAVDNVEEVTVTATGSVTPTSLPHTNVRTIPTSGYYIRSRNPGPTLYGRVIYNYLIIDFSTL